MAGGFSMAAGGGPSAGAVLQGSGNAIGMLAAANEFDKQIRAQNALLQNTADMVLVQRDALLFDLQKRTAIVAGSVLARAGKSGVTISGSVINAIADVEAMAAVDRLRINVNAQNAVNVIEYQKQELTRQARQKTKNAILGSILSVAGGAIGAPGAGAGIGSV